MEEEEGCHLYMFSAANRTSLEYLSLVTDYVSIPLCVLAILADVLLITVILKYKKLKTRTNYYLINFAAFHICYIISTPLFYVVLDVFYCGQLGAEWYCVWIRLENLAIALLLTFAAGFGVDAFFDTRQPRWFSNYDKHYRYLFNFFYFLHFLVYLTSASVCLKNGFSNNFNFYFLTAYYFVVLIFIFYVSYREHRMEKSFKLSTPNKAFALNVSVTVLLCWLPLFVFYNLVNVFTSVEPVEKVLWYTTFLPEYLAYCCSIIVVCKLWTSSKYFKAAFRKIFRRPVPDSEYEELNGNEGTRAKP